MIKRYKELTDKIKSLTTEKQALRDEILSKSKGSSITEDTLEAHVSTRLRVTYDLEQLEYELAHLGLPPEEYGTFKVCIKKLEKLLAEKKIESSLFDRCSTVNEIKTLTVKENK